MTDQKKPIVYDINGSQYEFDSEPTEADIDSIAKQDNTTLTAPDSTSKPGIVSILLNKDPQQLARQGNWIQSGALKTTDDVYREVVSPFVSGASTLAFGIPKAVAKETGTKDLLFPEQESTIGKAIRAGSEITGFTMGGALKAGKGLALKVLPRRILAGVGIGKKVARLGIEGAIAGALQTPEEGLVAPEDRLKQAVTWGALGGALPLSVQGIKGVGGFVTGAGRFISREIGGVTEATMNTIARLGAKRVFDPLKSAAEYISADLVPRIQQKMSNAVQNFGPRVQSYAIDELGIPVSAVNSIKKYGVNSVNRIRDTYKDSTDLISQKITQGFGQIRSLADEAYNKAVVSMKGDSIDASSFYGSIQSSLRKKGWVDLTGSPTRRYKGGLDPVMDKLTDLYIDLRPAVTEKGKKIAGQIISKEDFVTYRDALGSMLKDRPSDIAIMQARQALYNSAERSGMTGLKNARDLERKVFEMEGRYINSRTGNLKALGTETSLDKFHKLTKDQVRQLRDIENYTGVKFVDDLDALTASKYLDNFQKLDPSKIITDLSNAKNPNMTNIVKSKYESILGPEGFRDEFDDLMAHFSNADFELVSSVPGVGGGIYPSKSGLLRAGVANLAKFNYKTVSPAIKKIGNSIESVVQGLRKEKDQGYSNIGKAIQGEGGFARIERGYGDKEFINNRATKLASEKSMEELYTLNRNASNAGNTLENKLYEKAIRLKKSYFNQPTTGKGKTVGKIALGLGAAALLSSSVQAMTPDQEQYFPILVDETSNQESHNGRLSPNVMQITHPAIVQVKKSKYWNEIKDRIKLKDGRPDRNDPDTSRLIGETYLKIQLDAHPEVDLSTPEARARFWKKYYNTKAGAGTEKKYLKTNQYKKQP